MSQDIFSYTNSVATSGQIASADFARISVKKGGGANSMVQNCNVNYGHTIEEVSAVGSTMVFWMPGKPQGRISVSTLVGSEGFFSDWASPCGKIDTASIRVTKGNNVCGFEGQGGLQFSGAVVENLTADISTGRQTISQGAQVRVGSMRRTG